ncbi:uncharacterized protein F5147DRAFT_572173, partial [Suillus discolor]
QNVLMNSESHSLKAFVVTILSIVGHAGKGERTFPDLGTIQSMQRCNLSVEIFETPRKILANFDTKPPYKPQRLGFEKSTRHRHA